MNNMIDNEKIAILQEELSNLTFGRVFNYMRDNMLLYPKGDKYEGEPHWSMQTSRLWAGSCNGTEHLRYTNADLVIAPTKSEAERLLRAKYGRLHIGQKLIIEEWTPIIDGGLTPSYIDKAFREYLALFRQYKDAVIETQGASGKPKECVDVTLVTSHMSMSCQSECTTWIVSRFYRYA